MNFLSVKICTSQLFPAIVGGNSTYRCFHEVEIHFSVMIFEILVNVDFFDISFDIVVEMLKIVTLLAHRGSSYHF